MSTLRHWFDPAWPDSQIYELSGRGSPYLAYHACGALLTALVGDALRANLLLLTAVGLAIPFATRSLLRAFDGDERLALFACVVFWCRPLALGFLPFMAAVPVALAVIAAVVRQAAEPTLRRGLVLAASTLFAFYLHLDAFILIVAVAVAVHLAPTRHAPTEGFLRRFSRLPVRLAWLAPAAASTCAWVLLARSDAGGEILGHGSIQFEPVEQLPTDFAAWTHGIWRPRVDTLLGVMPWVLLLPLAANVRVPERGGARGLLERCIPFACALALFVFIPFQVGVTSMLGVRLAVFLLPCLLVVVRPDPGRLSAAVFAGAALLAGAVSVEAAVEVYRADRAEASGIDDMLALVSPGSRLLTLDFVTVSAYSALPPWFHIGALHRLRGGGVASVSFSEVPHWPFRFRPGQDPPHVPGRSLEWQPCRFRNALDGPYFDYVLARGHVDPFRESPPGPAWRQAGHAGDWALYGKIPGVQIPATGSDQGPCGMVLGR